MFSGISPINSTVASTNTLALAIAAVAQSDGDYTTVIPALSLHRRNMPTAPMHCISTAWASASLRKVASR